MSDVRVKICFRNDLLQRLVDESGIPLYKLAPIMGVSYHQLLGMKSLGRSPYTKGRAKYNTPAIRIAAYFNMPVEVLFPEEIYRIKWPSRLEKAFPVERIAALVQSEAQKRRALMPHEAFEEKDRNELIAEMLETLTPREERVIRMRFGLDDKGHTLDDIAAEFEVTRERIRQIEGKAIRKLRHKSRLGATLSPEREIDLDWKRPATRKQEPVIDITPPDPSRRGPKKGSKWSNERRVRALLKRNNGEYYSMSEEEKEKAWKEATKGGEE